jgi:cytochrome c556
VNRLSVDTMPAKARRIAHGLRPIAALVAIAWIPPTHVAVAEDVQGPQALIEARQEGFKKMGAAMKAITEQLKGDSPNAATLAASIQAISAGTEKVSQWFPAGSGSDAGVETDALPNIWTDRTKFDALTKELGVEVKSLAASIATNDLAGMRAQLKRTAGACSTCHRSFRAD